MQEHLETSTLPPHPSPTSPISSTSSTSSEQLKGRHSPAFLAKLDHMRLQIAPLLQITSGAIPHQFPPTLLNYWLLTEAELDELAHFYHQRTPSAYSGCYPKRIAWDRTASLGVKRRKFGKFIGFRNCDTPVEETAAAQDAARRRLRQEDDDLIKYKWY
ncbi:MAG: hypothetical protein M1829_006311 [Trizodia sp. TS-e1964]|nr:MAG: hypothetical protein M1829_006311 [Trizodia sp. TS-e1964]